MPCLCNTTLRFGTLKASINQPTMVFAIKYKYKYDVDPS